MALANTADSYGSVARIYAAGAALAVAILPRRKSTAAPRLQAVASDWIVTEGTLEIGVQQIGQAVCGSFSVWTAAISFDETPTEGRHGTVTVTIATNTA